MGAEPTNNSGVLEQNLRWKEHVHEGWHPLFEQLLFAISKIDPALRVINTKQKFGSLRVRLDRYDARAYALIDRAMSESLEACEHCGAEAALRNDGGYFVTLCAQHAGGTQLATASPSIAVRLITKRR